MHEYEVRNQAGEPLAILEAADRTDAELYTQRKFGAAARVGSMPSTKRATVELREAFERMGFSEGAAKIAAEGRDSQQPSLGRIIVPRQLAGGTQEELTEAQRQRQETSVEKLDEALGEQFQRLGLSESGAKIAARGRERD